MTKGTFKDRQVIGLRRIKNSFSKAVLSKSCPLATVCTFCLVPFPRWMESQARHSLLQAREGGGVISRLTHLCFRFISRRRNTPYSFYSSLSMCFVSDCSRKQCPKHTLFSKQAPLRDSTALFSRKKSDGSQGCPWGKEIKKDSLSSPVSPATAGKS